MRKGCCLLALILAGLVLGSACAETNVYLFTAEDVPPSLLWGVADAEKDEITLTLTFAGDCTLGGETDIRRHPNSFSSRVRENGMVYPFAGLQPLFATDDFTLVNLEGVLGDDDGDKVKKKYSFLGDADYTAILTEGSVECVNLANNHAMDFGPGAYRQMTGLLTGAGVGYVSEDVVCVLEKDGVRVGLTASLFALSDKKREKLARQMALLKDLNCQAIIHSMHGGEEYADLPTAAQKKAARVAADCGAALVVGHHPHVVQGAEIYNDTPIIYSLGNNSFGGNFNPSDQDALLLRAAFHFQKGELTALDWTLYPISISGTKTINDYQPILLEGKEARRVMERVADRSSIALLPYEEGAGAKQATVFYHGQEDDQNGSIDKTGD